MYTKVEAACNVPHLKNGASPLSFSCTLHYELEIWSRCRSWDELESTAISVECFPQKMFESHLESKTTKANAADLGPIALKLC